MPKTNADKTAVSKAAASTKTPRKKPTKAKAAPQSQEEIISELLGDLDAPFEIPPLEPPFEIDELREHLFCALKETYQALRWTLDESKAWVSAGWSQAGSYFMPKGCTTTQDILDSDLQFLITEVAQTYQMARSNQPKLGFSDLTLATYGDRLEQLSQGLNQFIDRVDILEPPPEDCLYYCDEVWLLRPGCEWGESTLAVQDARNFLYRLLDALEAREHVLLELDPKKQSEALKEAETENERLKTLSETQKDLFEMNYARPTDIAKYFTLKLGRNVDPESIRQHLRKIRDSYEKLKKEFNDNQTQQKRGNQSGGVTNSLPSKQSPYTKLKLNLFYGDQWGVENSSIKDVCYEIERRLQKRRKAKKLPLDTDTS